MDDPAIAPLHAYAAALTSIPNASGMADPLAAELDSDVTLSDRRELL